MNYVDIIQLCNKLLDKEPPTTAPALKTALKELEMARRPLLEARIEAQLDLAKKRAQYLHPKDRDLTNLDREIMLASNTTTELQYFEILNGLESLIADRCATLRFLINL